MSRSSMESRFMWMQGRLLPLGGRMGQERVRSYTPSPVCSVHLLVRSSFTASRSTPCHLILLWPRAWPGTRGPPVVWASDRVGEPAGGLTYERGPQPAATDDRDDLRPLSGPGRAPKSDGHDFVRGGATDAGHSPRTHGSAEAADA